MGQGLMPCLPVRHFGAETLPALPNELILPAQAVAVPACYACG